MLDEDGKEFDMIFKFVRTFTRQNSQRRVSNSEQGIINENSTFMKTES
jgi:hypothetical protein